MTFLEGLEPQQQRMSLERVPEHRAIVAAWEAARPRRATVRLPRADAPTGRPLRDDEWIEIAWTVAAPEDEAISGKTARRQQRLRRLLAEAAAQNAAPTHTQLADALGVGLRTIERDMAVLQRVSEGVEGRRGRRGRERAQRA
jgi:hypothetical protein